MNRLQDKWFSAAVGRAHNPDHMFGLQCKDVLDSYAKTIFKGKSWAETVRPANSKDVFKKAPGKYWLKIRNNPRDPNQLPKKGDWIVYPGKVWNGWFGHGGVVVKADHRGVTIIQQDGFLQNKAHIKTFSWKFALPTGWIRPKTK